MDETQRKTLRRRGQEDVDLARLGTATPTEAIQFLLTEETANQLNDIPQSARDEVGRCLALLGDALGRTSETPAYRIDMKRVEGGVILETSEYGEPVTSMSAPADSKKISEAWASVIYGVAYDAAQARGNAKGCRATLKHWVNELQHTTDMLLHDAVNKSDPELMDK